MIHTRACPEYAKYVNKTNKISFLLFIYPNSLSLRNSKHWVKKLMRCAPNIIN